MINLYIILGIIVCVVVVLLIFYITPEKYVKSPPPLLQPFYIGGYTTQKITLDDIMIPGTNRNWVNTCHTSSYRTGNNEEVNDIKHYFNLAKQVNDLSTGRLDVLVTFYGGHWFPSYNYKTKKTQVYNDGGNHTKWYNNIKDLLGTQKDRQGLYWYVHQKWNEWLEKNEDIIKQTNIEPFGFFLGDETISEPGTDGEFIALTMFCIDLMDYLIPLIKQTYPNAIFYTNTSLGVPFPGYSYHSTNPDGGINKDLSTKVIKRIGRSNLDWIGWDYYIKSGIYWTDPYNFMSTYVYPYLRSDQKIMIVPYAATCELGVTWCPPELRYHPPSDYNECVKKVSRCLRQQCHNGPNNTVNLDFASSELVRWMKWATKWSNQDSKVIGLNIYRMLTPGLEANDTSSLSVLDQMCKKDPVGIGLLQQDGKGKYLFQEAIDGYIKLAKDKIPEIDTPMCTLSVGGIKSSKKPCKTMKDKSKSIHSQGSCPWSTTVFGVKTKCNCEKVGYNKDCV
jgi:hypothetical protein